MSPREGASGGSLAATPDGQVNQAVSQKSSRSTLPLQTRRCSDARAAYLICSRILALTRSGELVLPHPRTKKIARRLRALLPSLQPAAAAAVLLVTEARAPGSFSRWVRRHRRIVGELLRVSE